MKDLPKVFANRIEKEINKSQNIYYGGSRNNNYIEKNINIDKKINDIFSDSHYVYKSKVKIITKDGEKEKIIVGKTSNSLLTISGEVIKINDILDIEKI